MILLTFSINRVYDFQLFSLYLSRNNSITIFKNIRKVDLFVLSKMIAMIKLTAIKWALFFITCLTNSKPDVSVSFSKTKII